MTRAELIEDAQSLTEHKADSLINFERIYARGLQKFCASREFWWRQKIVSIVTEANTPSYDMGITDFEQVSDNPLLWLTADSYIELTPTYDQQQLIISKRCPTKYTGGYNDSGASYMIEAGAPPTIRIFDTPDGVYNVDIPYWAIPNPQSDDPDGVVPLVPAIYHHVVLARMVMDVTHYLYKKGQVDASFYLAAKAEYDDGVDQAVSSPNFTDHRKVQATSKEEAIRSSIT